MQTHKSLPNIKPGLAIYTYWPTPIEMEVELRTSGNNIFDSSTDAQYQQATSNQQVSYCMKSCYLQETAALQNEQNEQASLS